MPVLVEKEVPSLRAVPHMSRQGERVYIAGASSEIERIELWSAALRKAGVLVVSTWPEVVRKVGSANPMTATRNERAGWANTDLNEIVEASVFWLLLPTGKPTAGAYTELGFAILQSRMQHDARNMGFPVIPLITISSGKETSIFTALTHRHTATDDEAFAEIVDNHTNGRPPIRTADQKADLLVKVLLDDDYDDFDNNDEDDDGIDDPLPEDGLPKKLDAQLKKIFAPK